MKYRNIVFVLLLVKILGCANDPIVEPNENPDSTVQLEESPEPGPSLASPSAFGTSTVIRSPEKTAVLDQEAASLYFCVGSVERFYSSVGFAYPVGTYEFEMIPSPSGIIGLSLSASGPFTPTLTVPVDVQVAGEGGFTFWYMKVLDKGTANIPAPCANPPHENVCSVWTAPDGSNHSNLEVNGYCVESLEIDPGLSSSPVDPNPGPGGGLRIFPGRRSLSDASNRRRVTVRATTTVPGAEIRFKSFDVDDPFTDDSPIDGTGPDGGDNRGGPGLVLDSFVEADGSGVATTEFEVTLNPGDNFRIAAGCSPALSRVTVQGTDLVSEDGEILATPSQPGAAKAMRATEMLTVWRDLHVEVDRMDFVVDNRAIGRIASVRNATPKRGRSTLGLEVTFPAPTLQRNQYATGRLFVYNDEGKIFSTLPVLRNGRRNVVVRTTPLNNSIYVGKYFELIDNDDYNNNSDGNADELESLVAFPDLFDLVQDNSDDASTNLFADAYIRLRYDGGGNPANNQTVPFLANVPHDRLGQQAANVIAASRQSWESGSDDFWVAYIQIAYQGGIKVDNDPNGEDAALGYTPIIEVANTVGRDGAAPSGGVGSFIYLETIRDHIRETGEQLCREVTAPHELGHQLGLMGHRRGDGTMSDEVCSRLGFVDDHIDILRSRRSSPGK